MAEACIQAGQQWVNQLVETLQHEYQETVTLTRWNWKVYGATYLLRLAVDAQSNIAAQVQGFTRGQLRVCGNPDPVHNAVRQEMERALRWQFALLAHQQSH